jgi:anti-anti-sigma regulatory factor
VTARAVSRRSTSVLHHPAWRCSCSRSSLQRPPRPLLTVWTIRLYLIDRVVNRMACDRARLPSERRGRSPQWCPMTQRCVTADGSACGCAGGAPPISGFPSSSTVTEPAPDSTATAGSAEVRRDGGTLVVVLSGAWTLGQTVPSFEPLVQVALAEDGVPVRRIAVDADALEGWDSSLLIFLLQIADYCEAHEVEFDAASLPDRVARLLALARAVPERVIEDDAPALVACRAHRQCWTGGVGRFAGSGDVLGCSCREFRAAVGRVCAGGTSGWSCSRTARARCRSSR